MKRSRYIFIIGVLLLAFTSCNQQQRDNVSLKLMSDEKVLKELNDAVETVNKSCPIQADERTRLLGASFSKNRWTYHYVVNEDSLVRFDNETILPAVRENLRRSTHSHLLRSYSMLNMLRALVKVNADLVYEYHGSRSGRDISIIFTFAELHVMTDIMSSSSSSLQTQ